LPQRQSIKARAFHDIMRCAHPHQDLQQEQTHRTAKNSVVSF
jgi:hypothetical protein